MARLSQVLVPKDRQFFDLFEEAGGNIVRAADLLDQMLRGYPDRREELTRDILICEQEGDRITHDIIRRLNETFVTPIDREDIYALASALDDIVDYTEEVGRLPRPVQDRGADGAVAAAGPHAAPGRAPDRRGDAAPARLRGHLPLHGRGQPAGERGRPDRRARRWRALFDGGIDPMVVIRWKDIYERLENAIDATERAANILEGIVIKNVTAGS